ncbi:MULTISPECIES: ABC transporter permease [Streptomyces]|uniref:Transport permease protein n=2 Tax=Streptomyces TaxID=1883 RepID=A0ABX7E7M4_9ACTN|nr:MULTISPECIES: ABC transporter permease [Streptomyces]NUV33679.1 ABC transporter permease [Streptomyces sp. KAI-27]NUV46131.1 ABC transporter permease [Streptomyces sp. CAI-78]MBL0780407.1 ABC transporter permease [Streptomyces albidoflavus]MBL0802854.1 ABC transporter permease [Streptomyces albidoflavus]MBV1958590.1 ABC transporter permease [Streptomyces sp. BV333]
MTTQLAPPLPPAVPRPAAVPAFGGSSLLTQIRVLTGRSLRAMVTDPGIVLFGLIQPVVILFVLTQVFSKMGMPPHFPDGVSYLDYVLPAVLVDNAAQSAMQSGVGLVEDQKNGIVARLRSLPVHPGALLAARSLVGLVRSAVQIAVIMALAMTVLGYSPNGGAAELALSAGLTLFISFSLGWAFIAAGAWLRRAEPLQNLALIVIFPLMFASSAYVPVADLPAWLGAVASVNPLTYAIDATRALALDVPGLDHAIPAVVICAVIALAGMAAAVRGFRRPL